MLIGTWSRSVARVFEVKEEGDARGISRRNGDLKVRHKAALSPSGSLSLDVGI